MSFWKRIFGHSGDNKASTPSPTSCNPDDPTQSPCSPPLAPPPADTTDGLIGKDRVIRVFISSTFRDMNRERELLVKQVFPELRRLCAERFVTFTEVDLRWGITEEQAAEGKVLPICLEEIQRSRPYFIGLLGERYGWIPDGLPLKVIEREPWLKEHVGGRTSVTELEILHGVLRNPAIASHAFFLLPRSRLPGVGSGERSGRLRHGGPGEPGETEGSQGPHPPEWPARLGKLRQPRGPRCGGA